MGWNLQQLSLNMKTVFLMVFVLAWAAVFAFAQEQTTDASNGRIGALLQQMHDEATWGMPTTNAIQLGAAVFNGNGVKQFRVYTYLYDETNFWIGLYPPSGHRLTLSLVDPDGKELEKTKAGEALCEPVSLIIRAEMKIRTGRTQAGFDALPPKNPMRYESPFNLLDCFKVEKAGTNTLTVGASVYKMGDDNGIYQIALPPVSIKVPITQADLVSHRDSKNDGK